MMGLWSIFATVLLAELGDKTQVATLLFAADPRLSHLGVFIASAGALAFFSLLAVFVGGQLSHVGHSRGRLCPDWPVDPPGSARWVIGRLGRGKLRPRLGQSLHGRRWQPTPSLRSNGMLKMFYTREACQGSGKIGFIPGEAHRRLDQITGIPFFDQKRQRSGVRDIGTVVWS